MEQFRQLLLLLHVQAEHPPRITQGGLGGKCTERDDLGNVHASILRFHIVNHFIAAVIGKIDIDIRHRHTFGVQETLEQKIVTDRIHIGDIKGVGNKGACGKPLPGPVRIPFSRKIS